MKLQSKRGFTLIELLIVVAILAVLAAIAVPMVAGLIDRANVSSDKSNANEMTNAIERFVSEYEMAKQDIYSNSYVVSKLDASQGRVHNAVGVETRQDIYNIEIDGLDAASIALNRSTKYPVNEKTVKQIILNYMKVSSAAFTPKQSDCSYYYSPELGKVVVAPTGATKSQISEIAFADQATVELTEWINLSINDNVPESDWSPDVYATNDNGSYTNLITVSANRPVTPQSCSHPTTSIKEAKKATCAAKGYTGDTVCDTCSTIIKNGTEIKQLAHQIKTTGKTNPTCTEDGYTGDEKCSVCNTVTKSGTVIVATGHTEDLRNFFIGNCSSYGYTGDKYCSVCDELLQNGEETPALGHINTETIDQYSASCMYDGYTGDIYCNDCQTIIEYGDLIPALGHIESEWQSMDSYSHCTVCERSGSDCYGDIINYESHDLYIADSYEGTCCEEAYEYTMCYVCSFDNYESLGYGSCYYAYLYSFEGSCCEQAYDYMECEYCYDPYYEYYGYYGSCCFDSGNTCAYCGICVFCSSYDCEIDYCYNMCHGCGGVYECFCHYCEYCSSSDCWGECHYCFNCDNDYDYCVCCGNCGTPYCGGECLYTCNYCGSPDCYEDCICHMCGEFYLGCICCPMCGTPGCDGECFTCDFCGSSYCSGECLDTCWNCGSYGCYGECMEECWNCGGLYCDGSCYDYYYCDFCGSEWCNGYDCMYYD